MFVKGVCKHISTFCLPEKEKKNWEEQQKKLAEFTVSFNVS